MTAGPREPRPPIGRMQEVAERLAALAGDLPAEHGAEIDAWRHEQSEAFRAALADFQRDVAELSGGNPLATDVAFQAGEYLDWLQWTFWDLPYFALAVRPERAAFRRRVAACGLVYLAIRVLDDVLDRHFWYRGRRHSLLARLARSHGRGRRAESLTVLSVLLLVFEGVSRLTREAADATALERTVAAARRVMVGLLMEESEREAWSPAFYERLVELKNVDYWRTLYAAVDPQHASPLSPFLERYYAVAQKLNDLQDHPADEGRGQPNLVSILRPPPAAAVPWTPPERRAGADPRSSSEAILAGAEALLADDFAALAEAAAALPPLEAAVAAWKSAESLAEARRLGLFGGTGERAAEGRATQVRGTEARGQAADGAETEAEGAGDGGPPHAELSGLSWYSSVSEIVERLGPGAVVDVACPVCGADATKRLFTVQGFRLVRCTRCFHAYVNPRLGEQHQALLAAALDHEEGIDPFLEIQRLYAEPLARVLHREARGPRLLDVGCGKGHLMHVARAYGFEVFGLDASERRVAELEPFFRRRLVRTLLDGGPLPWGSFDVVVLSHVVEHLGDPGAALARVREALAPDGLAYVAVPDLGSVQFQLLGRRWNVVNPLVHFQYFNQRSLTRLLEASGFEVVQRVEHPPLPERSAPRWTRLIRDLGGSESGELALLARRRQDAPRAAGAPEAP